MRTRTTRRIFLPVNLTTISCLYQVEVILDEHRENRGLANTVPM